MTVTQLPRRTPRWWLDSRLRLRPIATMPPGGGGVRALTREVKRDR